MKMRNRKWIWYLFLLLLSLLFSGCETLAEVAGSLELILNGASMTISEVDNPKTTRPSSSNHRVMYTKDTYVPPSKNFKPYNKPKNSLSTPTVRVSNKTNTTNTRKPTSKQSSNAPTPRPTNPVHTRVYTKPSVDYTKAQQQIDHAFALYKRFELEQCRNSLEHATAHLPMTSQQKAKARFLLGAAYYLLGNSPKAKEQFCAAKRASPLYRPSSNAFPKTMLKIFEQCP